MRLHLNQVESLALRNLSVVDRLHSCLCCVVDCLYTDANQTFIGPHNAGVPAITLPTVKLAHFMSEGRIKNWEMLRSIWRAATSAAGLTLAPQGTGKRLSAAPSTSSASTNTIATATSDSQADLSSTNHFSQLLGMTALPNSHSLSRASYASQTVSALRDAELPLHPLAVLMPTSCCQDDVRRMIELVFAELPASSVFIAHVPHAVAAAHHATSCVVVHVGSTETLVACVVNMRVPVDALARLLFPSKDAKQRIISIVEVRSRRSYIQITCSRYIRSLSCTLQLGLPSLVYGLTPMYYVHDVYQPTSLST
jgi:hypothetical protein